MEDVLRGQGTWVPTPPQEGAAVYGANNGAVPHMYDASAEVVISGISARLPESDNMEEFRQHLMLGEDMVTEDDRRWQPGTSYDDEQYEENCSRFCFWQK